MDEAPRLAELVGALSLATDLAAGFGLETALRTSFVAVELGRALGLTAEPLRDVYYTGLLRFIGCTAFSHEQAFYGGGDDLDFSYALSPVDGAKPKEVLAGIVTKVGRNAGGLRRARAVMRTLADPQGPVKFATAHCDLAVRLAARLGMSEHVVQALGQIYERWDGKGNPSLVSGEAIGLPARLMHVAWRAEVHRVLGGAEAAVAVIRERAGAELDPKLAALFVEHARELLRVSSAPSVWDAFVAAEPAPFTRIDAARVGQVAEAFAHFVDVKSPFTLGHSTGVARLAHAAAQNGGFGDAERIRIAALLHDLGRVSVPNGIWDKPGKLNPAEWERVRLHAYHSERILAQSPLLAAYAPLAGQHHERVDGSGYHRGLAQPSREALLLGAADAYHALTEERAHRSAYEPERAAKLLADEARGGRYARDATEAVLAAAGHARSRVRGGWPADLSEREVEVLCLVARGLSNKQIAQRLFISQKTVQHHIAHIFEKTGVASRAGAAVFAVENDLAK